MMVEKMSYTTFTAQTRQFICWIWKAHKNQNYKALLTFPVLETWLLMLQISKWIKTCRFNINFCGLKFQKRFEIYCIIYWIMESLTKNLWKDSFQQSKGESLKNGHGKRWSYRWFFKYIGMCLLKKDISQHSFPHALLSVYCTIESYKSSALYDEL